MGIERPIVTLSKKKYEGALSLPLLDFEYFTPKIDLDKYDALIITSKEAVAALGYLNWQDKKVYCVGEATAKLIPKVAYSQKSGGAQELVQYLKINAKEEKLLYCRAQEVSVDIAELIVCDEVILYRSFCKELPNGTLPDNAIIIFSSPSTIQCFLQRFTFKMTYSAIALGKTTQDALKNATITSKLSPSTAISDAIEYAKSVRQMQW